MEFLFHCRCYTCLVPQVVFAEESGNIAIKYIATVHGVCYLIRIDIKAHRVIALSISFVTQEKNINEELGRRVQSFSSLPLAHMHAC